MSSKKRSKSRSRSTAKSQKPDAYGPASDEVKKGGFLAMLLGMTLSLMLIFWIASLFNPQSNDRRSVAQRKEIDDSTRLLESSTFDQLLKSKNPDQILAKINALKASKSPRLSPARVAENNQRVELCKRLLELDASPSYKTFAKLQWMQAQKSNYGIDFIGAMHSDHVADEFQACFTPFLNDTDKDVYQEAHLARVSYVLFECIKGNRKPQEVAKELNDVLERFPDSDLVSATIRLQFKVAIESDINLAKQLAEEVLRKGRLKDERAADLIQYVLDTHQIVTLNYNEMFVNRFTNGDVGLRELEKTSLQLVNNPEAGAVVVDAVDEVTRWFELRRMYDTADRIYKGMEDASQLDRKVVATKGLLLKIGQSGRKRLSLVGKKIPLSGTTMTGKKISDGDFKNRVVLVVFFDPKANESIKLVRRVARSAKRFAEFGSPIRIVAVPSSDASYEGKLRESFETSRVQFLDWVDGKPPALLSIYPVVEFPHLIAIDHEGNLARIGVSQDDYGDVLEAMVDRR